MLPRIGLPCGTHLRWTLADNRVILTSGGDSYGAYTVIGGKTYHIPWQDLEPLVAEAEVLEVLPGFVPNLPADGPLAENNPVVSGWSESVSELERLFKKSSDPVREETAEEEMRRLYPNLFKDDYPSLEK